MEAGLRELLVLLLARIDSTDATRRATEDAFRNRLVAIEGWVHRHASEHEHRTNSVD